MHVAKLQCSAAYGLSGEIAVGDVIYPEIKTTYKSRSLSWKMAVGDGFILGPSGPG
jgi:hypothetical protein